MTKYTIINRETYPRQRPEPSTPTVNFCLSTGVVYFSNAACRLMGISAGDHIEVLQSEQNPMLFGFRKTNDERGFKVHAKRMGVCFAAKRLVVRILTTYGLLNGTTAQLGTEPRDGAYWAIARNNRTMK